MAAIFSPGALRELFGQEFNQISTLPIDITLSEAHTLPATVTDKPIEDGSTINDNVIVGQGTVSVSGIFRDEMSGNSQLDKWAALKAIQSAREPFTLTTSMGAYVNMVLLNISADRSVSNVGALFFTAELKQVRIIASQTVQVPLKAVPEERKAKQAPKQDRGKQQAQKQTAEQQAQTKRAANRSFLTQILE